MCCDVHEVLWIKLNPARLPRGFSCVILAVVYYPGPTSPAECDAQLILNHLFDSLMKAQSIFSNCGLVVTGDFNRLKTSRLQNHFKLKQLVKFPTRGQATLDLILTNMADKYAEPESFPPFGLSDHVTVIVAPKVKARPNGSNITQHCWIQHCWMMLHSVQRGGQTNATCWILRLIYLQFVFDLFISPLSLFPDVILLTKYVPQTWSFFQ